MERRHKRYLRVNLVSLVFVAISFISVTLAWFAYSGITKTAMDIDVKAWYIELSKDGEPVTNDIVISLSDVYPGMDTVVETISINNKGDSDATVNYGISSARILNDEYTTGSDSEYTSQQIENMLAQNYPFHINVELDRRYILAKDGSTTFKVSISWPLDSDDNTSDSYWGNQAYTFQNAEKSLKETDSSYQIRQSIQVVFNVVAEQYINSDETDDARYNLGDEVLYDPVNKSICAEVGNGCFKTYVIDKNNKTSDNTVNLMLDPATIYEIDPNDIYQNYDTIFDTITDGWKVTTLKPTAENILNIISKDIEHSLLVRENISDRIIGNLSYQNSLTTEFNNLIENGGYYKFLNEKFSYITSNTCYWVNNEIDSIKSFVVEEINQNESKLYENTMIDKKCNIVPIIQISK